MVEAKKARKKRKLAPLADRFWATVEKGAEDECWNRVGSRYGNLSLSPRPGWAGAHRVSWELHYGAIPSGMCVCHKCDNISCINPKHLFLGTQSENLQDASRKGHMSHHRAMGTKNPKAKLTEKEVLAILELKRRKCPVTSDRLGEWFGVSGSAIRYIWRGDTWAHLSKGTKDG